MIPRIIQDPEICGGKPTVAGTRVLVSVILDYLEEGATFEEIIQGFPSITVADIKAAIRFTREIIEGTYFEKYSGNEIHT
jgi:uncharacterized protein (DUF433 family)